MRVFIGADHNGLKLKNSIKKYLPKLAVAFEDLGNLVYDTQDDYPDFALKVAKKVVKNKGKGILICGSGAGVCIVANKIKGIRAGQASSPFQAKKQREDDDTNILCLSSWGTKEAKAKKIIKAWLETKFSQLPHHRRRIEKIRKIEKEP